MDLVEMGRRFHAASGQPGKFEEVAFLATMDRAKNTGALFTSEKGFIAGFLVPLWYDPNWIMAVEFAWWSEDGRGFSLLRQFEKWAKVQGANDIRLSTLDNLEKAKKVLSRRGYVVNEESWIRSVK